MRKVDDGGEKREGGGAKENNNVLVATNVVASQPPKHQPTGRATTGAKSFCTLDRGMNPTFHMKYVPAI